MMLRAVVLMVRGGVQRQWHRALAVGRFAAQRRRRAMHLFASALLLAGSLGAGSRGNIVMGVESQKEDSGRVVRIRTTTKPAFTVFRLSDPMRVVVDIAGGQVAGLATPIVVEDGLIGQIALRQFDLEGFQIGRVMVGFEQENVNYDVQAEGNAVVVRALTGSAAAVQRAVPPPLSPDAPVVAERARAEKAAQRAKQEHQAAQEALRAAQAAQEAAKAESAQAEAVRQEALRAARAAQEAAKAESAQAEAVRQEAQRQAAQAREESAAAARQLAQVSAQRRGAPAVPGNAAVEEGLPVPVDALLGPQVVRPRMAQAEIPGEGGKVVEQPFPEGPAVARLRGVRLQGEGAQQQVLVLLEGKPDYEITRVEDPPRLVIDFKNTKPAGRRTQYPVSHAWVAAVRFGVHEGSLRAVFDLKQAGLAHTVSAVADGLVVALQPEGAVEGASQEAAAVARIDDVRFVSRNGVARIEVAKAGRVAAEVDTQSPRVWVLRLQNARFAPGVERNFDASAYGTAVRLLSVYQAQQEPPLAHVAVQVKNALAQQLRREKGDLLVWEIAAQPPAPQEESVASAATHQSAGFATAAQTVGQVAQAAPSKKRITVDLKDADIVNVIRLLAEISGENIITSDEVRGTITLRLRDVPWDRALDTILRTKGYDKVRQNNILRIAPSGDIQKEREAEIARRKAQEQAEDTSIKMIAVNYATATEILEQIKPMLSGRGSAQVDQRTNTLIVEEVRSNIDRLVELTRRLDKQTPQVLIQARIVEAQSNYLQELGIQWGGSGQASARSGNSTGLMFPSDVTISGAADDLTASAMLGRGVSTPSRFAVNLPATIGMGSGGGIGFIFGSANGNQLLNLRLSAMEENGTGRIISSPRVTTLDNRVARISQGIDIPISVTSAAGVNTKFISAALELEVTPHVTNDGGVLMKVKTSKNEPDFSRKGANGDPTIVKKAAETEVLVRDGDTTVIGGIYTRTTSETYAEVPFFSKIPVLGWFFKKRRKEDTRAELLVFITPRIVNREEARIGTGSGGP